MQTELLTPVIRLRDRLDRTTHRLKHLATYNAIRPLSVLWHQLFNDGYPMPPPEVELALARWRDRLLDAELDNLEREVYPASLLEWPMREYLRAAPELLADMPRMVARKRAGRHVELPDDVELGDFPAYYRRNFHWQTDGWLSEHSARVYDLGVEFLFRGTGDVMRRQVLPPLVEALEAVRQPRVLDVACGTGQFLRQVSGALPRARLYGIDLSPHYIEHARSVLDDVPQVTLAAENAERLPFADGAFDAAYSIFLFHELPLEAQRNALSELRRVVKPGGTVVLLDSFQRGDEGAIELDYFFDWFPAVYHEPYYKGYVARDLGELAEEAGFKARPSEQFMFSKRVICS